MLDAAHHGQRISDAGFLHPHGLEPALQCLVLLDILAVLVEGGGTDDLDLAAGEGGLQDVARIHGTLALTSRGNGVDLVNEQDDVARRLDLAQQALDPLLELAAELGTCHTNKRRGKRCGAFLFFYLEENLEKKEGEKSHVS